MSVLQDILAPDLKVIFCGTAASKKSAAVGAPYAGPGNRFWQTLYTVGFTPRLYKPEEFEFVIALGIGLTNLAPHAIGNDDILQPKDFDIDGLRKKLLQFSPQVLAFTSKRAGKEFYQTQKINYGFQNELIGQTRLYVLPSPSGAARASWDIVYWKSLADYISQHPKSE